MPILNHPAIEDALRELLTKGTAGTQAEFIKALQKQGFEVNQSKISRLLRKMGAVKVVNSLGDIVYRLPQDPEPPSTYTSVAHLVVEILHNEMLIVVKTSPGSASLIARVLDFQSNKIDCIGSVAGDDTILLVPRSVKTLATSFSMVKRILLEK